MLKVLSGIRKENGMECGLLGSSSVEPVDGGTQYLQKDAGSWLSGPRFFFFSLLFTPVAQSFRSGEDVTIKLKSWRLGSFRKGKKVILDSEQK